MTGMTLTYNTFLRVCYFKFQIICQSSGMALARFSLLWKLLFSGNKSSQALIFWYEVALCFIKLLA